MIERGLTVSRLVHQLFNFAFENFKALFDRDHRSAMPDVLTVTQQKIRPNWLIIGVSRGVSALFPSSGKWPISAIPICRTTEGLSVYCCQFSAPIADSIATTNACLRCSSLSRSTISMPNNGGRRRPCGCSGFIFHQNSGWAPRCILPSCTKWTARSGISSRYDATKGAGGASPKVRFNFSMLAKISLRASTTCSPSARPLAID